MTEDKIIILSGTVSKKRYTKEFFNLLLESVDLDKLNDDLERKMDEKGNWFLRFDKEDAIDEKMTIKDSGDSIHLKIKIAAYPAKKEIAVDKVREAIFDKNFSKEKFVNYHNLVIISDILNQYEISITGRR